MVLPPKTSDVLIKLGGFGLKQDKPTVIYQDNNAAIAMSKNPVNHKATKHIEVRYHKIRQLGKSNVVLMKWVSTNDMLADMFTKKVGFVKQQRTVKLLQKDCLLGEAEC